MTRMGEKITTCTRCKAEMIGALLTPAGGGERLCRACIQDLRQLELAVAKS